MKLKTTKIFITFIILFIINTGCVNDDLSGCFKDNVELNFFLYPKSKDKFLNYVNSIDIFVFNSDSIFVTNKRIEKKNMEQYGFLGTYMSLLPGNYLIACWANVDQSTEISPMEECATNLNNSYLSMLAVPGDSLFYAPAKTHVNSRMIQSPYGSIGIDTLYTVNVDFGGKATKDIEFIRAYRTINVYVRGHSSSVSPSVELNEISTHYDFSYRTMTSMPKRAFNKSVQIADLASNQVWVAHFYTVYENITDNIKIAVRDLNTGQQLASVSLLSYVQSNSVSLDDIDILFEFSSNDNTLVKITLPPWGREPVIPIY